MKNLLRDLTDFSNDSLGIKACIVFIIFLSILIFITSLLGINGGRGGNPQESYQEEYKDY